MIVTMVNIDQIKRTVLIVVLEPDNWKRMEQHDAVTLECKKDGGVLETPKYPDRMSLMIAYENEVERLHQVIAAGNMRDLFTFLERGRKFIKGVDGAHMAYSINRPPRES